MSSNSRRDVGARKINLFQKIAQQLVRWGWTPNQVSVASSFFALMTCAAFIKAAQQNDGSLIVWLLIAIFGIQLRLVCNLIDGLMAIEGGLKTASGEIFNDFPDRVSDALIFIGAGFFAQLYSPLFFHLGWGAALMAVMTAYVRCLGAAMTGTHDFAGPMAKQHRMFIITLACVFTAFESFGFWPMGISISVGLILVLAGSTLTVVNRLRRLYIKLEIPR